MIKFFKSFTPLVQRLHLKKYLTEIILLTVALAITVISLTIYKKTNQKDYDIETSADTLPEKNVSENIIVDVSGSVKKPNIYKIGFGARIKDALELAGGLSDEADVIFFQRNFNLARIIIDQEKIYIPSISEINNGVFTQGQLILDYNSPVIPAKTTSALSQNQTLININYSSIEELDQLPGIGQTIANKIISNRPYLTLEDLLNKKIVNKSLFEKIKNLIEI